MQLLGDRYGTVVPFVERECSIQRRHQKLIEEAPSPALSDKIRKKMGSVVVDAAKAVQYTNAGTFEFLMDSDGKFYYMETNTRLQVEHPVTELVTGVDLIKEQIRVAAGEKLRYSQRDITLRGAAIECRINAEDPAKDFRPSAGTITKWQPPGGPGVRLDSHVVGGYRVPPNYDSMVAKLLVHRPTRQEAIAAMRRALGEFVVEGISTTIPLHRDLVRDEGFCKGGVNIHYLEHKLASQE